MLGPAAPVLREALQDSGGKVRFAAADALVSLGEFPWTKRELVYFSVGSEEVLRPEAKQTFLEDLHGNLAGAEYAVRTLVEFGEVDSVPHLADFLKRRGSAEIALWFTLCGQPELKKVAGQRGEAVREVEYFAACCLVVPSRGLGGARRTFRLKR